jgi:hypothetical protein
VADDQPSIAVADAGVIPVPPIGATARTGVPIGDAAIAAIIAIVVIAVVVIWEAAPDEEWKSDEVAVEVMEATVMEIVEVGASSVDVCAIAGATAASVNVVAKTSILRSIRSSPQS